MKRWTYITSGAVLGAGLMYLLDPEHGDERRSTVRRQLIRMGWQSRNAAVAGAHRLRRGRRVLRAAWQAFRRNPLLDDDVVARRVRSEIIPIIEDMGAIDVRVHRGRVTLVGSINSAEEQRVMQAVRKLPGVLGVASESEWPH